MLPSSHQAPTFHTPLPELSPGRDGSAVLAEAFAEFIGVSGKLEASFRELQREVAQLNVELAARNAALEASLRENEGMRLALVDIVDSMPCGVLVIGSGGCVLRMNPEACRLLTIEPSAANSASGMGATLAAIGQDAGVDLASLSAMEGESELSLPAKAAGAHPASAGQAERRGSHPDPERRVGAQAGGTGPRSRPAGCGFGRGSGDAGARD